MYHSPFSVHAISFRVDFAPSVERRLCTDNDIDTLRRQIAERADDRKELHSSSDLGDSYGFRAVLLRLLQLGPQKTTMKR